MPGRTLRPAPCRCCRRRRAILALDEDLDDLIVLEDGDPGVVVARGDDHLLVHGNSADLRERAPLPARTADVPRRSAAASPRNVSHSGEHRRNGENDNRELRDPQIR